jgi:PTH2 family peptidyl-tRNA hydrolase
MIKQVIIMRKDLNMRKGKMIAQGSHSSMKIFFDRMRQSVSYPFSSMGDDVTEVVTYELENVTPEMIEWIEGAFTKIVLGVNSLEELLAIKDKAEEAELPVALIEDNGWTEFGGIKTITCIAIGPDDSEKIDKITKDLKLL